MRFLQLLEKIAIGTEGKLNSIGANSFNDQSFFDWDSGIKSS